MSSYSRPNLTEERLRFWLDGNQLDRERMCQALLALDSRYLDVRPRHPKGGPDQGRDLEARLEDGRVVWAAIGFRNSVSNSAADKRAIVKKFKADLARALEENPSLKAFVFMTNVTLTATGQANLVKHARSAGVEVCDIFHGERLRILLDSPEGLGVRFQYLQISLSEAEQAAFFARWGNQLEQLISRQFTIFDQKLARLEFLHDCSRPLRYISIELGLSRTLSPAELGHFRLLLSVIAPGVRDAYSKLDIVARDVPGRPMESGGFWVTAVEKNDKSLEPNRQVYSKFSSLIGEEISFLSARGGFSEWTSGLIPTATLGDLDENLLGVFVTKTLASLIAKLRIVANGYILLEAAAEDVDVYEDSNSDWADLWPMELNDEEASVAWVRLDLKGGAIRLDFGSSTPPRLFHKGEFAK